MKHPETQCDCSSSATPLRRRRCARALTSRAPTSRRPALTSRTWSRPTGASCTRSRTAPSASPTWATARRGALAPPFSRHGGHPHRAAAARGTGSVVIADGGGAWGGPAMSRGGHDHPVGRHVARSLDAAGSAVMVELDVADPAHPRVVTSYHRGRRCRGRPPHGRHAARGALERHPADPADPAGGRLPRRPRPPPRRADLWAVRRALGAAAWLPRMRVRDAEDRGIVLTGPAVGCGRREPADAASPRRDAHRADVRPSKGALGAGEPVTSPPTASPCIPRPRPLRRHAALAHYADEEPGPRRAVRPRSTSSTRRPGTDGVRRRRGGRGWLLNQCSMSERDGRPAGREHRAAGRRAGDGEGASESRLRAAARRDAVTRRPGGRAGQGRAHLRGALPRRPGYVVTFRQTDPLFTLDLGDPAKPAVPGELKIPGSRRTCSPVGDGRLLGIGQARAPRAAPPAPRCLLERDARHELEHLVVEQRHAHLERCCIDVRSTFASTSSVM